MFSTPMKAVLYVLAQALMKLYNMSADWTPATDEERLTITGSATDYIAHLDNPATGADPVEEPAAPPVPQPAAAIFAPAAPNAAPVYEMIVETAGVFTREQYLASPGWTDELLISSGYMRIVTPAPVFDPLPNGSVGAPGTPPAAAPVPQSAAAAVAAALASAAAAAPRHLDKSGLPWDARIHSSGRTQTKDELWTKKKSVAELDFNRIAAELRAAGGGQPAAPFVPLNASAPAPAAHAPAAAVAPPPAAAPQAPGAAGSDPKDFAELCNWVNSNGLTMVHVKDEAVKYGLNGAGQLAIPSNAELIPLVYAALKATRQG